MTQLTIIGTGLIGGSFGLAIRKSGFRGHIVGCDRQPVLDAAIQLGAINRGTTDPVEACRGSQIVLLATPVGSIIDLIERLGPVLPPDVLLTDVGSTKAEILARARQVFGAAAPQRFLAGHPMAGKEFSGIDEADPDLFRGAPWFLVPAPGQDLAAAPANQFVALLETIGARVLPLPADVHDRLCAWTSHLPQMVAIALAATLVDEFGVETKLASSRSAPAQEDDVETRHAASPSTAQAPTLSDIHSVAGRQLREMTRTSASPYSMWRDVALTNTGHLEAALQRLEQRLAHIRENLRTPELRAEFEKANSFSPRRHEDTKK